MFPLFKQWNAAQSNTRQSCLLTQVTTVREMGHHFHSECRVDHIYLEFIFVNPIAPLSPKRIRRKCYRDMDDTTLENQNLLLVRCLNWTTNVVIAGEERQVAYIYCGDSDNIYTIASSRP